ncbi:collagen-like protein [Dyadobacter sp. CY261]|uniref:collagen-like triple helix repeat-containing protein n=1 Tax=Dyadobacter sp. CY261 TaxID=2907203 RepID=UPI001F24BFBD|nr:collagen-like protein [Dyadobacter sp. CY261]MCF0073977.1 collagen-like protein [Dyadobacter sp. CY261]
MKKHLSIRISLILLFFCSILFTISCEGPDGETGPAGPAGPQGAQGTQGIQGKPGNANVIASPWTKVPDSAWVANRDCTYYLVSVTDTRLNRKMLDSSLVMAYYRNFGRENIVFPLPSVTNELSLGFYMEFLNNQGRINFDLTFFEPRKEPIDFDLEFRWIIVPPDAGGRIKKVDWTDYEAVRSDLGLVD